MVKLTKTIIDGIRQYFIECDILDETAPILVDFNDDKPISYSINTMPGETMAKRYVDGGGVKQYDFTLTLTDLYTRDVLNQIDSLGFYEQLADWVDKQNKKRNFPKLPGNKKAIRVHNTTGGYLFDSADKTAVYQMQFKLFYIDNE